MGDLERRGESAAKPMMGRGDTSLGENEKKDMFFSPYVT
jgi:hypothetical protein